MNNSASLEDKIDLSRIKTYVLRKWYWLPIVVFLGVCISVLVDRYHKPTYAATASVRVIDEDANLSDFLSIELAGSSGIRYDKILTEAEVIRSRSLVAKAVDLLPLDIRYIKQGTFSSFELYRKSPFVVKLVSDKKIEKPFKFKIVFQNENDFTIKYFDKEGAEQVIQHQIGEEVEIKSRRFKVEMFQGGKVRELEYNSNYRVIVGDKDGIAKAMRQQLTVSQASPQVSILAITGKGSNAFLVKDFVDAVCQVYVRQELEAKSLAGSNAIAFIDDQIDLLGNQVKDAEMDMTSFRKKNEVIDIQSKSRLEIERMVQVESKRRIAELKLLRLDALSNELMSGKNLTDYGSLIDESSASSLSKMVESLNELKINKLAVELNYTEDSKSIQELDNKMDEVANSIRSVVSQLREKTRQEIDYHQKEINGIKSTFQDIPQLEQEYLRLLRNFEVNEKVISFLMEKKIEASIAKASVVPSVKIIDLPLLPEKPVSISKRTMFIGIIGACFLLCLMLLIVIGFFDDKVYDVAEIEKVSQLSVLGAINNQGGKTPITIDDMMESSRTVFSESVNSMRSNLNFLSAETKNQTICFTSTVSQEGKSFVAINLAASLTRLNKKVIIIDLDLRKPTLNNYLNIENSKKGSSAYLSGNSSLEEVIQHTKYPNLDFITAGQIPPNPIGLIHSEKFKDMLSKLRGLYDHIIIDNPPIGVVSDALYPMLECDITLYVVRSSYSRLSFLKTPVQLVKEHKLKNLHLLLNGYTISKSKYGSSYYAYGQGYYTDLPKNKWSLASLFGRNKRG